MLVLSTQYLPLRAHNLFQSGQQAWHSDEGTS